MAHCPHCGAQTGNTKFCGQCGAPAAPAARRSNGPMWIMASVVAGLVVVAAGAFVMLKMGDKAQPGQVTQNPSSPTAPSSPAAPGGNAPAKPAARQLPSDPNNQFVGLYTNLRVPGAAYTSDNGHTITLYTSTGTITASSLAILADGTYAWNSQWDGKLIQGSWVKDGSDLVLKKGQEGKDWRVMKSTQAGSDITVWDGSIWYVANKAKQ